MRRVKLSRVVANVTSNNYLSVIANNIIGVTLTSSNVVEVGNLFFTNARSIAAFTAGSSISIAANGLISSNATGSSGFTGISTRYNYNISNSTSSISGYDSSNKLLSLNTPSNVLVYYNGILLVPTLDYLANTTTISFVESLQANSVVTVFDNQYIVSSGSSSLDTFTFIGDGSQNTFSLNYNPTATDTVVYVNGLYQRLTTDYTLVGNTIVFSEIPEIGENISVLKFSTLVFVDTSNVSEGANLYFTNTRVYEAVTGNLALKANVVDLTTSNVIEGTNLYYSNTRVYQALTGNLALKANVVDLTTSNVTEGTNLYYTNARAYANTLSAIKTGNGIVYNSTTGNITLSTSGVTAGQYGTVTSIPSITINEFGRITNASQVSVQVTTGKSIAMAIVFGG